LLEHQYSDGSCIHNWDPVSDTGSKTGHSDDPLWLVMAVIEYIKETGDIGFADSKVDAVVFGHSHQPYCELKGGCLLFNPGSPTDRRFQPRFSYGLLSIDQTGVHGTINFFGP